MGIECFELKWKSNPPKIWKKAFTGSMVVDWILKYLKLSNNALTRRYVNFFFNLWNILIF